MHTCIEIRYINIPNETITPKPYVYELKREILHDNMKHVILINYGQTIAIYQPFHDEMQCDSLVCIREHISFHNLGTGRYDSSLGNVFSYETLS